MKSKVVRLVALVTSVGLAGCGDSTDLVLGELSEAEAQDLASAIVMTTFASSAQAPQQPAQTSEGPQAVPYEYSDEFNGLEVECQLGGIVTLTGSVAVSGDDETGEATVYYVMTQDHGGCVAMSEHERVFTLNGDPSLTLNFQVTDNGLGLVTWSGGLNGAVHWVTDNRENTCTMAIEFSGSQEGEAAVSAQIGGMMCGLDISYSFSIG